MAETPLNAGQVEWIDFKYRELTDDDLFWFTTEHGRQNKAFRKINDVTALDLSDMRQFEVNPNQKVYQKEY